MYVKDIIKSVADILDLTEIKDYLNKLNNASIDENTGNDSTDSSTSSSTNESTEIVVPDTLNDLLLAVNITNNNLASNYYELLAKTNVVSSNSIIKFSKITDKNILEIKSIENINGTKIDFKIMGDGIHLLQDCSCVVEYSYLPDEVKFDDDIDYYLKVNTLLFSYGVASEYLFLKSDIEDAYNWDLKFKNTLFAMSRPKRSIYFPSKRWY